MPKALSCLLGFTLVILLLIFGFFVIKQKYKKILEIMERLTMSQTKVMNDYTIQKAIYGLLEIEEEDYLALLSRQERLCTGTSVIAIFEQLSDVQRDAKEIKLNVFIIENVLKDIFEDRVAIWVIPIYPWEVVILNQKREERLEFDYVLESLEKARQYLVENLKLNYTVGISKPATGITAFSQAYSEAMAAIEEKQSFGCDRVISYSNIAQARSSLEYDEAINRQLKNYIKLGDSRRAEEFLESIYESYFIQNPIISEGGKLLMLNLMKAVQESAKELKKSCKLEVEYVLKKEYTPYNAKEKTLTEIKRLCEVDWENTDSLKNRTERILQYISLHYMDVNLNVGEIAEVFDLNPSYLSRIFKEQTGINLLTYINGIRVGRAKELLLKTEDTLQSICVKVGFFNVAALSRAFKKNEGITPGEYKTMNHPKKQEKSN